MQATSEQETKKPLTLTMPGRRLINCSKPEYLEFIQKTGFNNFAKVSFASFSQLRAGAVQARSLMTAASANRGSALNLHPRRAKTSGSTPSRFSAMVSLRRELHELTSSIGQSSPSALRQRRRSMENPTTGDRKDLQWPVFPWHYHPITRSWAGEPPTDHSTARRLGRRI